jgi:hypothetical protein
VCALLLASAGCAARGQAAGSAPAQAARPAPDPAASDARALAIADALMEKLGGRAAWDRTAYVTWNHVGRRRYLWDHSADRVRLERAGPRSGQPYVIIFDAATGRGRAWRGGQEVTEPNDLDSMLEAARREWINDSWWLLMPYRLRDPGVVLRYRGEGQTQEHRAADVLELSFTDAAAAPPMRFLVWVSRQSGLVEMWAGVGGAEGSEPEWTCRWKGWRRYGGIMLCGDRGQLRGQPVQLTEIAVPGRVPPAAFTGPDPIDWDALVRGRPQNRAVEQ